MPIDRDKAVHAEPTVREANWTRRDVLLYHLSLGAGRGEGSDPELGYTYERDLRVLPTFAMVAGQGVSAGETPFPGMAMPGIDVELGKLLHAGQELTLHRPLPTSGTATLTSRVADVWDKGKAAVIVLRQDAVDGEGTPLWTATNRVWARGEGGFGGESGPANNWQAPGREPDIVLDSPTTPDQALLYRLNGDLNPLHIDPEFAGEAGLDSPILHGLASYGIVAKAIVDRVLGGDPDRLAGLSVRFAGTLLPGETIRTRAWRDGDRLVFSSVCPERDDAPVLSHATAELQP